MLSYICELSHNDIIFSSYENITHVLFIFHVNGIFEVHLKFILQVSHIFNHVFVGQFVIVQVGDVPSFTLITFELLFEYILIHSFSHCNVI